MIIHRCEVDGDSCISMAVLSDDLKKCLSAYYVYKKKSYR